MKWGHLWPAPTTFQIDVSPVTTFSVLSTVPGLERLLAPTLIPVVISHCHCHRTAPRIGNTNASKLAHLNHQQISDLPAGAVPALDPKWLVA